jgi:hypothetical protein
MLALARLIVRGLGLMLAILDGNVLGQALDLF